MRIHARLAAALVASATLSASVLPSSADTKPQHWLVAKADGGSIAYETAVERDPKTGYVFLMSALYVSEPLSVGVNKPYQYVLSDDALDCTKGQFIAVTRAFLDGAGNVVDTWELENQPWVPIAKNPSLSFLQDLVCKTDTLGNAKEAANIDRLLVLMKEMAK